MVDPNDMDTTAVEAEDDGRVLLPKRRIEGDAEMDITPMIDITFLLLIFFLVASKLEAEAMVELPSARHGTAVTTGNSVILTVARGGGSRSALIYKGNGKADQNLIRTADLGDQQQEIADYVQQGLNSVPPRENVLIKAERGVKHREVARVARAVGTVDDVHRNNVELHVAVLEVE